MNKKLFAIISLIFFLSFHITLFAETTKSPYPSLPYKELIFPAGQLLPSHASSIVELPDGELFAVWYAATFQNPEAVIWGSRKLLGADKWTVPTIINSSTGHSNKNPVLYLGQDKKLFLFWSEEIRWFKWKRDILRMKTSKDFGRTWDEPRNIGAVSGFLPRNHPIRLQDGRIVLPIYMDWNTSSAVTISKDGGLTWESPKFILYLFGIQPTIIQRSDLSLFALMRTGTWPRLCWQAVSYDLGDTWKKRKTSKVKNPGSSLEMIKLNNGHIALVFNDSRTNRTNLNIALSYDEGRTWPCTRVIEQKYGAVNIYPSILQDQFGLIHVLYSYDGRKSIAHFVTNEQWIQQ